MMIIAALSECNNNRSTGMNITEDNEKSISSIEIFLLPAFNNYSRITIDRQSNTVQFKVDTTEKFYHSRNAVPFLTRLDSFRTNTLIDSFYSQTFLDSIKL